MIDGFQVRFNGEWGGDSPTAWAQHEQWDVEEANKPHNSRFNLPILEELRTGTSVEDVRRTLGALIERHESLRTTYLPDAAGAPVQTVARTGTMDVALFDGPDASFRGALKVRNKLMSERFETTTDWPVRFGLVLHQGQPKWLVGAISHITADMEAILVLRRDFRTMLYPASTTLVPRPLQPRDQAEFERSERGQMILRNSHAAWLAGLERVPALPLKHAPSEDAGPRFPAVLLVAKGLGRRLNAYAESLGTRVSAPCIAAGMTGIAKALETDAFPLKVSCNNRTKDKGDYAGMIAQQGLIPLDTVDMPVDDLIRRTWTGIIGTARTSRYDSVALKAMVQDHFGDDTPAIDHWINFVIVDPITDLTSMHGDLADGDFVCAPTAPMPFTTLRFGYIMVTNGEDLLLKVFGDRSFLAEETMRSILERTHELMIEMAARIDG